MSLIGIEKGKVHAPQMRQAWVNSSPIAPHSLRGVVVVDFLDYTSVNCIRTLPHLLEWHRRCAARTES